MLQAKSWISIAIAGALLPVAIWLLVFHEEPIETRRGRAVDTPLLESDSESSAIPELGTSVSQEDAAEPQVDEVASGEADEPAEVESESVEWDPADPLRSEDRIPPAGWFLAQRFYNPEGLSLEVEIMVELERELADLREELGEWKARANPVLQRALTDKKNEAKAEAPSLERSPHDRESWQGEDVVGKGLRNVDGKPVVITLHRGEVPALDALLLEQDRVKALARDLVRDTMRYAR
ncbi:MAG: hypothetical protein RL885_27980 [Planctomycetota bacterium]